MPNLSKMDENNILADDYQSAMEDVLDLCPEQVQQRGWKSGVETKEAHMFYKNKNVKSEA